MRCYEAIIAVTDTKEPRKEEIGEERTQRLIFLGS
jgi:hypothetical protein